MMAIPDILKHRHRLVTSSATSLLPHFFIHLCRSFSCDGASPPATLVQKHGPRTIEVFWDMDNKPPIAISPVQAAKRLKGLAAVFGHLVNVVIYASKFSLKHLPQWSLERRCLLEAVEMGVREEGEEGEVYVCGFCGHRSRSNYSMQKHFKGLHEKEHEWRVRALGLVKKKGKNNCRIRSEMEKKEERFKDAVKVVSLPDKGYGLAKELQRVAMPVVPVSNKPGAAAMAQHKHMLQSVAQGINCVWLVSHDVRFVEVLEFVKHKQLHVIVTSDNVKLQKCADVCFTWGEIVSRIRMVDAKEAAYLWSLEDSLTGPPSPSNFLTTQLTQISTWKDLRPLDSMQNLKSTQTVESALDQFESTFDLASEMDFGFSDSDGDD